MARTVRNAKRDTRSSRARLTARREPYWTVVSTGCAVGYRKGAKGGTWIARFRSDDGSQSYEALGASDDARDADGVTVLDFTQAQAAARAWFARRGREDAGLLERQDAPYRVCDAMRDYFDSRARRGSRGLKSDQRQAAAHILPSLGSLEVAKLTSAKLRRWHEDLANAPPMVRTKAGIEVRNRRDVDMGDPNALRARRASANRVLTILKAALNYAFAEGRAAGDEAWRKVKPFAKVDEARISYLSQAECVRLVNAADPGFRPLVQAAILTGCRYGELASLAVNDFNADSCTLHIRRSKSGKPRHVVLTAEAADLFRQWTAGKTGTALIFTRADGRRWKTSEQARPMLAASQRAGIDPPATFHALRHTHGSTLAMNGVPMRVIANQLGHADTRITERHYAHLSPSYVAETIRKHFPTMGLAGEDAPKIVPLRG